MSTRHPGVRDEGSLTKKKEKPGPSTTAAQKVLKENSLAGVKAGGLHFLSAGVGLLPIAVVSQLPESLSGSALFRTVINEVRFRFKRPFVLYVPSLLSETCSSQLCAP